MLFNLLGNALRYTVSGGITLTVEVLSDTFNSRSRTQAPSIPPEMPDIIWKPFARATDRGDGRGIELYTVATIDPGHGPAPVGMHSTPGRRQRLLQIRLPYQEQGKTIGEVGARRSQLVKSPPPKTHFKVEGAGANSFPGSLFSAPRTCGGRFQKLDHTAAAGQEPHSW